jgi:hypothetical protein
MEALVLIVTIIVGGCVYFLPALIAGRRNHHNQGAIFVVNAFLGWTFLGWVVALAMASGETRATR